MLPMIKRRLTGQIAGIVGAFGNVGGVLFLTLLFLRRAAGFFPRLRRIGRAWSSLDLFFVEEPKGQIAEIMPDGSVTMIDVA